MSPSPLQSELRKRHGFEAVEQEVYLNLVRTQSILSEPFERFFKAHDLSGSSYNVLRILRGQGEAGCLCHEIGEMMVVRVPDVTRLVDRLESQGLAQRTRSLQDRRAVHVSLTPAGLALLASLDEPLLALHRAQFAHLSHDELDTLNTLLVRLRTPPPTES